MTEAFAIPPAAVTNATGTHPFARQREFVFVTRARGPELSTLAGAELALRTLNERAPVAAGL